MTRVPEFLLREGSMQHKSLLSRAKVRLIAGGFANGKTTAAVQMGLKLSALYPGSNGIMGRSTYPKLNDTLRKEFLKWCPPSWIKSFPMSVNASNTCTMKNGTTINFRYLAQQGRSMEASTSNLLSATYDWAIIDQIEDPEIVEKDYDDLLGRLRGSAPFIGDPAEIDPVFGPYDTMPRTGPRWLILTANPTRNWLFKRLVKPIHVYRQNGTILPELFCARDLKRNPVLGADGKPHIFLDLFEGSTYENQHVLEPDYIETLEAAYIGQMRDRFLMGEWAAYEGLVYPQFSEVVHCISRAEMREYLNRLNVEGYKVEFIEGYDFGIASPSCYLLAFVDHARNIFYCDGFYRAEMAINEQASKILRIRREWDVDTDQLTSFADPDIFKRRGVSRTVTGLTIADMFLERDIMWQRGNNNQTNAIVKVGQYLTPVSQHRHPIYQTFPSPYAYFAHELTDIASEFGAYYWQQDQNGVRVDKPKDGNDHALDALKYSLSRSPALSELRPAHERLPPAYLLWQERDASENMKAHRYGKRH